MPTDRLRALFSMLKTREEVLREINSTPKLCKQFNQFLPEQQERFLDICTGARGLRVTYDKYFKYVFDTDIHRNRLEKMLSAILEQKVTIKAILPIESICVASDKTLLEMDIIVELADGSIANVEIQRRGYDFPGQRAACYAADLLLRQYKRVRDDNATQKKMSYKDIKPVYTIVFFEKSASMFHAPEFKNTFIHHASTVTDSGLHMELLQNYYFIPLDIFREIYQNKDITTDLEAWIFFLAFDSPKQIMKLISLYPYFTEMYKDLYTLASNTEKVIGLFSQELAELDEGTVQYMLDEYEEKIQEQNATIAVQNNTISEQNHKISKMSSVFDSMKELARRFENGEISQDEYNSAIKQFLNSH